MMRVRIQTLLAAMIVAVSAASGQATILFQHSGSADPATEGFEWQGYESTGKSVNDGGVQAWNIAGEDLLDRYNQSLSAVQSQMLSQGWYLDVTMRKVLSTDSPGALGGYIEVSNGSRTYNLAVGSWANDLYVYQSDGGYNVDPQIYNGNGGGTGTNWHTLRLVVAPNATVSSPAHFYVDGNYQCDVTPKAFGAGETPTRFVWGATGGYNGYTTNTNWAGVLLSTGTPIPEPATRVVLASATLSLLAYAWRRSR